MLDILIHLTIGKYGV